MDGLLRSVGSGVGGFFGNAIGAVGAAARGAVDSLNVTFHGAGGVVLAIAAGLILLVGVLIVRR